MTWFDALLMAVIIGFVVFEARQEAGRALLDAVAALSAAAFCPPVGAYLTLRWHWKAMPGTDVAPPALAIAFAGLLVAGLVVARFIHRRTRWSMEHYDVAFGLVFGVVIGIAVGHGMTDVAARWALAHHGHLPDYLNHSLLSEELRSFRSYHYVMGILEAGRKN